MNTIPTLTQKYNDLKSLVFRSFTNEDVRRDIWNFITCNILAPDKNKILEKNLEIFEELLGRDGVLHFFDFYAKGREHVNLFAVAEENKIENPYVAVQMSNKPGIDPNLVRFFYMK